ncbi:MAG: PAS domain-containing protein, partial [Nitriliruptorales bacterium]|nr:PAS domain-containing protein [Nitriliruptorales bacterium]
MNNDPMVVLQPSASAEDRPAAALLAEAVGQLRPHAVVDGVDRATQHLREADVALVVISPAVDRPLLAGRELRRTDDSIGVAYVATPGEAADLRLRIGMLAELRGAVVIETNGSATELAEELRSAAAASARRSEVSRAIDHLNRQLVDRARTDRSREPGAAVPESHLAAIVRHVPEAIVSVGRDHRVVAFNDAAAQLFDLEPDDSIDMTLQEALGRQPALHQLMASAIDGTTITGEELEFERVGGNPVLLAVTGAPVRDHTDSVIGAVLVARDITAQRRSEDRLRQLQKAQSLATLAGGVAHDFNNLLVSVRSWAQLAAEDPDDEELLATALNRIEHAADRAAELARSMLVYSGRGRFELEPVGINELARQMVELLHGSIHPKIELRLELDPDLPQVEAAPVQLRQVLMNLITNAAEAIGDDPGTVTIRTLKLSKSTTADPDLAPADCYVLVEVADTGPGMDRETLDRAFEP